MAKAEQRTITLARFDGLPLIQATGRLIRFSGFEGIDFVLHKIRENENDALLVGKWRVTEVTTGRFVGRSYPHPNEALHDVKAILTKAGKGGASAVIAKYQVLNPKE